MRPDDRPAAEFATFAHWLCWMSHERPVAADRLRNESEPVTRKPRPPLRTDGGAAPPTEKRVEVESE